MNSYIFFIRDIFLLFFGNSPIFFLIDKQIDTIINLNLTGWTIFLFVSFVVGIITKAISMQMVDYISQKSINIIKFVVEIYSRNKIKIEEIKNWGEFIKLLKERKSSELKKFFYYMTPENREIINNLNGEKVSKSLKILLIDQLNILLDSNDLIKDEHFSKIKPPILEHHICLCKYYKNDFFPFNFILNLKRRKINRLILEKIFTNNIIGKQIIVKFPYLGMHTGKKYFFKIKKIVQEYSGKDIEYDELPRYSRQPFTFCKRLTKMIAPPLWEECEHLESEIRMIGSLFVASTIIFFIFSFICLIYVLSPYPYKNYSFMIAKPFTLTSIIMYSIITLLVTIILGVVFHTHRIREVEYTFLYTILSSEIHKREDMKKNNSQDISTV